MNIGKINHQSLPTGPEVETSPVKPPSSGTASGAGSSGHSDETLLAHESPGLPKRPIDEPLSKASLLEKLGAGKNSSLPSAPSIRMDMNIHNDPSGTGWGAGGSDGSDDNNAARQTGVDLSAPSRFEGDGHSKFLNTHGTGATATGSSGTQSSSTTSSSGTSSTSSQSSTTGTTSGTTPHGHKK